MKRENNNNYENSGLTSHGILRHNQVAPYPIEEQSDTEEIGEGVGPYD